MYTRSDAPAGGRKEAPPTQAAPPRADQPHLTEADVRRLIADVVRHPPQEKPAQVGQPTPRPVADTASTDTASTVVRPVPTGMPRDEQPTPSSRGPDRQQPASRDTAPELLQKLPENPASSPKFKGTSMGGRGCWLCRRLPFVARRAPNPSPGAENFLEH